MENNTDVQTIEQIKIGKALLKDLLVGELNVLWKMLGTSTPSAARARLMRGSESAIKGAREIITNRENLISKYQNQ